MSYRKTCKAMEELMALDVSGDLDGAETRRLESHLASCSRCRYFSAEMRRSHRAVRLLSAVPVDPEVLNGVRSGVVKEIASPGRRPASILRFPRPTPRALRRWLVAAAAILLMTGVGWWRAIRPQDQTLVPLPEIVRHQPPPPAPPVEPPRIDERKAAETVEPRAATAAEELPEPGMLRTSTAIAEAGQTASRPMVVKWLVDDPDLVIYWLIETDETTEETTDEPKEA